MFYYGVSYNRIVVFMSQRSIYSIFRYFRNRITHRIYLPSVFFDSIKIIKAHNLYTLGLKIDLERIIVR